MVVMSTVGFGDYSPSTVFSRFFIFFAIFGGVLFFSLATGEILSMSANAKNGGGKYRPKRKKGVGGYRGHILVLGGGVSAPTKAAVECFLRMLCRYPGETPEVVLLGHEISDEVKDMCAEPWAVKFNVQFFKGSGLNLDDMNRVKASETSMVFIIADFMTPDVNNEDQNNILTASAFQRYFPTLPYRLMAVEVQSLELAAHVGLNMFNCYAIDGFKAAILATSLKCPGFQTMVLNMGLPEIPKPKEFEPAVSPWLSEYIASTTLEPYGFLPAASFHGQTFDKVAQTLGHENITVFAAQVKGSLRINPGKSCTIDATTVLFVLAEDVSVLNKMALNGDARVSTWLGVFGQNRKAGGVAQSRKKATLKLDMAGFKTTDTGGGDARGAGPGGDASPGKPPLGMKPILAVGHAANAAKTAPKKKIQLPSMANLTVRAGSNRGKGQAVDVVDVDEDMTAHKYAPPEELRQSGGHAVICLLYTEDSMAPALFAQVEVIVNNLRHTSETPVVIIGPPHGDDTESMLERIHTKYMTDEKPNVFFVEGDPLEPATLEAAGVRKAEQFLNLSPAGSMGKAEILDRVNLLAQAVLDNKLRDWGRADLAAVYDWFALDSFGLMPEPPSPFTSSVTDPLPNLTKADRAFMVKYPRCHYRYASGRVLPKPLIAGVYSMAYYTPGVLELFEALIDPSKTDQTSFPWPMPIPDAFTSKPYAALAKQLLGLGAIPMGILRASGGPLPYVLNLAPGNTTVRPSAGDAVYVLASVEWAEKHLSYSGDVPAPITTDQGSVVNPLMGSFGGDAPVGKGIELPSLTSTSDDIEVDMGSVYGEVSKHV